MGGKRKRDKQLLGLWVSTENAKKLFREGKGKKKAASRNNNFTLFFSFLPREKGGGAGERDINHEEMGKSSQPPSYPAVSPVALGEEENCKRISPPFHSPFFAFRGELSF